jgi:hypothetical protein
MNKPLKKKDDKMKRVPKKKGVGLSMILQKKSN